MEAEHEEGPDCGPTGDAVLLQMCPGATDQALPLLAHLLQHSLQLDQVCEGGGPIRVSKQEVGTPA